MSSNSILEATATVVQTHIVPYVPQVWQRQFRFGLSALALRPFASGNANARATGVPSGTAESKMSRLLANKKLPATMAKLTTASMVNVDHADFDGLVALVFASQTRKGRTLPVFLATAYSGKLSARDDAPKRTQALRAAYSEQQKTSDETSRTLASLRAFRELLGFWPKLVFDRGFGGKEIVQYLVSQNATFYIRMKADRYAELDGSTMRLKNMPQRDSRVMLYGIPMRVIRSPKNGKDEEPWYILTNDLKRSRTKVIRIYYRFEIEETFRDVKSLLGLGKAQFNKPLSLAILLWFTALGVLLLYRSGLAVLGKELWRTLKPRGHKKRISWFRMLFELREQELRHAAFGYLTSPSGLLEWREKW